MCSVNVGFLPWSCTGLSYKELLPSQRSTDFYGNIFVKVFHFHFQHKNKLITMIANLFIFLKVSLNENALDLYFPMG